MITSEAIRCPEELKQHCPKCGEPTTLKCLKCNANIQGVVRTAGVRYYPRSADAHCHNCGAAYPWKNKLEQEELSLQTPTQRLDRILQRFHSVARQVRSRYNSRETLSIKDEYDVQDLLHALLRIHFDDIRPEEWTPSYAGKSGRMDFLLKPEKIVVEAKMTRKGLADKDVGDQLIVDIDRYKEHPDCKCLVCFVYDPDGYIRNPKGLCSDLERDPKVLDVSVVVTPVT
jgi:hypothetical protein